MGNKVIYERFLWFEDMARRGKYPNATTLSNQFEISLKTAQRDIEFMRSRLGCPLIYDKSKKGYHFEDGTFPLPQVYLSSVELSALLIARRMLQDICGGPVKAEISSVVDKITSIIRDHTAEVEKLDDAVSFQLTKYTAAPDKTFKAVLECCLSQKSISFSYYSPINDEHSKRVVDPYHLLNYEGKWHLIAYCHKREDIRDFVLGRISNIKPLSETFLIQRDFDINDHLQSAFGIYKGKGVRHITLRFPCQKARLVREQLWHKDQKMRLLKNGSLELSFPAADYTEVMMEVLKCGSEVEVVKPKGLRDLIKAEAKKISKIY